MRLTSSETRVGSFELRVPSLEVYDLRGLSYKSHFACELRVSELQIVSYE